MDITKHGLFSLLLFLLWTNGLTDGSDVNQTDILWKDKGDSATMNCSHTKSTGFTQMYWYRQLPGETMELIVFTAFGKDNPDFGNFGEGKFSATKPDTYTGTFTVKNLEPGDEGLYFCSVSTGNTGTEAYFGKGTKLTVLEPNRTITAPTVKVLKPCKSQKGNKTLVCVARGFYPDHVSVSWEIDDVVVDKKRVATDNAAVQEGKHYRITSMLRVSEEEWYTKGKKFHCAVRFFNGTDYVYSNETIWGKWKVVMNTEQYLITTRVAKISYGVIIAKSCVYGAFVAVFVWKLQGSAGKQDD